MEMPVFALHSVLFPGQAMGLQVFEPRYLALVADVAHTARFVVVAIEQGQEVGGTYEPYRVGVDRRRSTPTTTTTRTRASATCRSRDAIGWR